MPITRRRATPQEPSTPPLTDRIILALRLLRRARQDHDPAREIGWQSLLDSLIDRYANGER